MVLPFICFLLNTDLLFVKGKKKEKKRKLLIKPRISQIPSQRLLVKIKCSITLNI